jgi:hypothetical protein
MLNQLQTLPARQLTVLNIRGPGLAGALARPGYLLAAAPIAGQGQNARIANLAARERGLRQRLRKAALDLI